MKSFRRKSNPARGEGARAGLEAVLACAVLIGWVVFLYRDAFAVYFLNEDFTWLQQCRLRPGRTVWTLLTQDAIGGIYSWRPVLQMSFGLNHALWGVNPFGYRLASVGWHAVSVCVLYAIAAQVADRSRGLLAAALFAAHPLHVEPVSWTSAGSAPVASAFVLLAVLGYLRWRSRGGSVALVLGPFALALATQESAVVFPGLVVAADLFLPGPAPGVAQRVRLYAALLAVLVGFLLLRRLISPAALNFGMMGLDPRWQMTPVRFAAFLLGKLRSSAALLLTLPASREDLALPVTAFMTLAAVGLWWRGQPAALWGLLWIGIALAPFTLFIGGPFPRYMHLPLAGVGLLFAEVLSAVSRGVARWGRRTAPACVAVSLVLWLGYMVTRIDAAEARFVERGRLTRNLLLDLLREVPDPRPGSTLGFYRVGDLRVHEDVFVYGLEDAVRLFYGDDSLRVEFRALGDAAGVTYPLLYSAGGLHLLPPVRN